jgi:hypothetical protein
MTSHRSAGPLSEEFLVQLSTHLAGPTRTAPISGLVRPV